MPYIRISLMKPKPGLERDVAAITDALVAFYRQQEGFLDGYKLRADDESGHIGRVTIWTSEQAADVVAQMNHVLSQRSALMPLIEEGSDEERGFHAVEASAPLAEAIGGGG